jgi:hypothetical protein
MLIKKREVRVHQILTRMTAKEEAALLVDLARYAETECPCIVLNCSNIFTMHRSTLHLLLSCLEVQRGCSACSPASGRGSVTPAHGYHAPVRNLRHLGSGRAELLSASPQHRRYDDFC